MTQIERTRRFTDCDGREIGVEQLAPPPDGVRPVVSDTVTIDLRAANTPNTVATESTTTEG